MPIEERPLYHFHPEANWMNDPNGLIQWQGQYHLFYQYNPHGPYHGTIHWGHATSRDLAHWTHAPIALTPSDAGPDEDGCYSGCAVDDHGVPTLIYTGIRGTDRDHRREATCLATSADNLRTWTTYAGNPVIAAPPEGLDVVGFRDPYVWKEGDTWYQVIGSGVRGQGGTVFLYASPDLIQWDYLNPLYHRDERLTDSVWTGSMWECPQFFPLGDKHVLIVSVWDAGKTHYTVYFVGSYAQGRFAPESVHRLDLGADYYAPATMLDDHGRRLIWGWSWEGRSQAAQQASGWAGVMSLPRELTLRADGTLGIQPVPELQALRGVHVHKAGIDLTPDSSHVLSEVKGDCLEISATFDVSSHTAVEFGLLVRCSPGREEYTRIYYDAATRRVGVDRDKASQDPTVHRGVHSGALDLDVDERLTLRVFVDRSIVEVYANGRTCLTERIYPSRADSRDVDMYARGGEARVMGIDVWDMAGSQRS